MPLSAPEPISREHILDQFDCGQSTLNAWLKSRAWKNEQGGGSRTYVVCDNGAVKAYYCLATGAVAHLEAPGRIKRNMPDPVPVMVIGRLAVDQSRQGEGVARALLRDAITRTLNAAEIAGIRAILVHVLNEEAAAFYAHVGFLASPIDPLILMLPLETVR